MSDRIEDQIAAALVAEMPALDAETIKRLVDRIEPIVWAYGDMCASAEAQGGERR